jgi:hypothetical protein
MHHVIQEGNRVHCRQSDTLKSRGIAVDTPVSYSGGVRFETRKDNSNPEPRLLGFNLSLKVNTKIILRYATSITEMASLNN